MSSFDFEKVLTTGANGMIGSYVDFGIRTDREMFDVTDAESVMHYAHEHMPQAIVHLAGATDMVRCEQEPAYAYELNVRGTYNVARAARAVGAVMVYASTSRVFSGSKETPYVEGDVPEPDTHYGRSKHIGELITAAIVPQYIIARTSWVFGGGSERDSKFYGKILRQLESSVKELSALNDVRGTPTYGKDYVDAIKKLLGKGERGTFHVGNAGVATRHDLAVAMVAKLKSDTNVRAVDRSHFASGATLPTNESISSRTVHLRPWQEALAEYIDAEWASHVQSAKIIP